MKPNTRPTLILIVLAISWVVIALWQYTEHQRVVKTSRQALLNRGRDITTSLGVVIRTQSRFGATRKDRLEKSLNELLKMSELEWVSLQSPNGLPILTAGPADGADKEDLPPGTTIWKDDYLTVVELVHLGYRSHSADDSQKNEEKKILLMEKQHSPFHHFGSSSAKPKKPTKPSVVKLESKDVNGVTSEVKSSSKSFVLKLNGSSMGRMRKWYRDMMEKGIHPTHPPWMSKEQYQKLFETHGLHKFALNLSAKQTNREIQRDLWLRIILVGIALLAVVGVGMAWLNLKRSSRLALDLVRSHEANAHLREMNIAAAGLAHETRNPLNVVRGLAQLVSKSVDEDSEVKANAVTIVEEVDRVNSRLNEFITYSKPRDPKLTAVALGPLVESVAQALSLDCDEKHIELSTRDVDGCMMADEGMLRQTIFNLLINAIQAVGRDGKIQMRTLKTDEGLIFEISDNGPGVPVEARDDIFRPYFSLHDTGTGLGLAVVRQIALAHGWDLAYVNRNSAGACFQISGINAADAIGH